MQATLLVTNNVSPQKNFYHHSLSNKRNHHHHQSIIYTKSYHFYMVFLGIVCKIRPKYSKELLDYNVKNTKTYIIY